MKIKWFGARVNLAARKLAGKAIGNCCERLRQEAVDEAPKDIGTLRGDSGCRYPIFDSPTKPYGLVYFGGEETKDYALIQHENMDYAHTIGKAKYLEDPLKKLEPKFKETMRTIILGGLRGTP